MFTSLFYKFFCFYCVRSRITEPSHFDGSSSPKNRWLRLIRLHGSGSGSGSYLKKVHILFCDQNLKILRFFVCIILGRSRSHTSGSSSWLRLRPDKKMFWLCLRLPNPSSKLDVVTEPVNICLPPSCNMSMF